MKRVLLISLCAAALAIGCGDDEAGSDDGLGGGGNNSTSNNSTSNNATNNTTTNGASNNGGTNNATTNGASNNGGTNGGGSNNGGTNSGTNNGTTGTNNGTTGTNNGTNGTNNTTGAFTVDISYSPTTLSVGDDLTLDFTITGDLTLSAENMDGAHVAGEGHYHVYVDTVDEAHELAAGADDPLTVAFELTGEEITAGDHDVIVVVHRNDHTEFDQPVQITLTVTVE